MLSYEVVTSPCYSVYCSKYQHSWIDLLLLHSIWWQKYVIFGLLACMGSIKANKGHYQTCMVTEISVNISSGNGLVLLGTKPLPEPMLIHVSTEVEVSNIGFITVHGLSECHITPIRWQIWVNIGSGNGLLPDGTKPLPEPMLTYHQWHPVTIMHLTSISHKILQPSITKVSLKIIYLKFNSNLPGADD